MTDIDPINDYIESVKQQMAKKIDQRYWNICHMVDRLLLKEGYCLSVLIGKFDTITAMLSAGLKVHNWKEWDLSIPDGKRALRRRIAKHEKLAKWLKDRKDKEIERALAKIG